MVKKSGPVIGSAKAPMISSAGKDHVIFSKKLLLGIAVVLLVTAFLFFTIEQSRIAGNLAKSRAALAQNLEIENHNARLEAAKQELEDEEDELVNLYSQWLDQDSNELELSQEQLEQLKAQLKSVTEKIAANSESLKAKDGTLSDKETTLRGYEFKIQQKQKWIEDMAKVIASLNGTVPKGTGLEETVDDLVWNDEFEGEDEVGAGDDWVDDDAEW
jgi:hypothetical protein